MTTPTPDTTLVDLVEHARTREAELLRLLEENRAAAAAAVREARERRGLDLDDVRERVGMTKSELSRLETAKFKRDPLGRLARVARTLATIPAAPPADAGGERGAA